MTMLAFRVEWREADWCVLIHGKTRGEAKKRFVDWFGSDFDGGEFIDARVTRIPSLDDKPFTYANMPGNFLPLDEDGEIIPERDYRNWCNCPICKEHKA